MKKHIGWNHTPYSPPFVETGDIYICRIEPHETSVRFDWLPAGDTNMSYSIMQRKRGEENFEKIGETAELSFTLQKLSPNAEYEFCVQKGDLKSRTRIVRTGKTVGDAVVNYLHPDDTAYAFSGRYLCSPCIVRHPDGYLLSSMDVYESGYPQVLTLIMRSDDNGESWYYLTELFPAFWSRMFIHAGELYVLACSTEYGDLLIGKSSDGGKTFTEPVILLRGGNGKNGEAGIHKNPQPVVYHRGRIWNTLEWGNWARGYHAPMVMSADENADLLDPTSWSFSEPVKYDPTWEGVPKGPSTGNIEGCLVPVGEKLYNIMRYDMHKLSPNYGKVIAYEVNTDEPESPLRYAGCIDFPANHSKFVIKYDEKSGKFWAIADRITAPERANARTLVSLFVSDDCKNWRVACDLIDRNNEDMLLVGFQYMDFIFDGDDIIWLCRTADCGAASFHDSNYQTFHRTKNFRQLG